MIRYGKTKGIKTGSMTGYRYRHGLVARYSTMCSNRRVVSSLQAMCVASTRSMSTPRQEVQQKVMQPLVDRDWRFCTR